MRFTTEAIMSLLLVVGSASAKSFHHMAIHKRAGSSFVGCFSSAGSLSGSTTYMYQSTGWCSDHCTSKSSSYFATTNGKQCLCGNSAPDSSDKVATSKCDTDCAGYPDNKCMLLMLMMEPP
jgi:cell wall integrity and stress response component